ncbi:MAG: hypothetical protein J0H84_11955 [Rhizobiales bacterium]|nr:hypothetical protein [Hyphomicrobiales bacterium]
MQALDPADAALARSQYAIAANRVLLIGERFRRELKAGFHPNEPRIPAGNPGIGGQWTDEGGVSARVVRVQSRGPRGEEPPERIAGRLFDATPAEEARLEISQAQMQAALRRVQQLDPNWKPRPSLYETIEGEITANEAATREAQDRLRIGRIYGCHTCGTKDPGTRSGNFFVDHQPPNARNNRGRSQRIFPHCMICSARQGNWLSRNK